MNSTEALAKWIAMERRRGFFLTKEVADYLKISIREYCDIEYGEKTPSKLQLKKISNLLGVDFFKPIPEKVLKETFKVGYEDGSCTLTWEDFKRKMKELNT